MNTLRLELTVHELKAVLQALGQMPYVQVQELIGNLQLQATPQLEEMNKVQTAAEGAGKDGKKAEKAA